MSKHLNSRTPRPHVNVRAYKTLWEERIESEEIPGLALTVKLQESIGLDRATERQAKKRRQQ
jgi:hypothetical protein